MPSTKNHFDILLVAANKAEYVLIADLLKKIKDVHFNLDWAKTYQAGLDEIALNQHDVYLIDQCLNRHTGLDLLHTAIENGCQAPLLLLTEGRDRQLELDAIRAGAADYLIKSQLRPPLLERAIRYAVERKSTEEKLRQSEERFRMALKHSPVIVFNQDTELRYTWIYNPPPHFKSETILGKTDADLFSPEEAAQLTKIKRKVLQTGTGARQEVQTTIDGRSHIYDLFVEPLRDATGKIIGVTCTTLDITDRKRTEEALQNARTELEQRVSERTTELAQTNARLKKEIAERQRLEQAVQESLKRRTRQVQTATEIAQEIATTPQPDELFRQVVNLVQKQFGYYHAHVYTLENGDLVMQEGTGKAGQQMKQARHKIPLSAEKSLVARVARSGEPILVSDVYKEPSWLPNPLLPETKSEIAVPIKLGDEILGVLDVQNDKVGSITPEDEILLMGLCGQIAVAINNRHLEAERQKAELAQQKLIEDLDAFAHTVGYNLRDPLALIIGYTELLKEQARLPEELQEYLNAIARNGHKLGNIIDELQLLTGVRKAEVELKPLNMARIVAEVQQRLAYLIQEYNAKIIVSEYWPVALGHKPWVEEVWANYISNAIKYGGDPPRVQVGATAQSDGMIRFWVRDNGPGLTAAEQSQLFTELTHLKHIQVQGYGLGLSIVRRIITKLGGTVSVESDGVPGKGSVFSFTLPSHKSKQTD